LRSAEGLDAGAFDDDFPGPGRALADEGHAVPCKRIICPIAGGFSHPMPFFYPNSTRFDQFFMTGLERAISQATDL
jgi:hypothetical protein